MREFEYPVLDCEAIGGRIREERVRRSFTIQEVCDALSVSPQAVGKWQRGESLPSIDNLVALCTLFDVSLEGILFGEDRMPFPMGYVGSPAAYRQIHSTTEKYCREMAGEIIKYYR